MKLKSRIVRNTLASLALMLFAGQALSGQFDFDDDEKKDMQSAWLMCALTGFTQGDCPSIFAKCWKPPMIYLKRSGLKVKVKTHCVKLPSWDTSDGAVNEALAYASENTPEPEAYSPLGNNRTQASLPPECITDPTSCMTIEDERRYYFALEAYERCSERYYLSSAGACRREEELVRRLSIPSFCRENPSACAEIYQTARNSAIPPICVLNPSLCENYEFRRR